MDRVQNGTEGAGNSFIKGTILDHDWQQDMQEELLGVIEAEGLTPAQGDTTQLNAAIDLKISGSGGLVSSQVFTSDGTWNKPAGVTRVLVKTLGAGGGGSGTGTGAGSSAGAGAGAYSERWVDVTSITSETVTVGVGGAGGVSVAAPYVAGANGGVSSFGAHTSCNGGFGGLTSDSRGGITPSLGDIKSGGGDGGIGKNGGASFFGGGSTSTEAEGDAPDAQAIGSGGAPSTQETGVPHTGGDGANGIVIVEEYA